MAGFEVTPEANSMQPLFALEHAIFADDHMRLAEYAACLLKTDAVLRDVDAILPFVPFEPYRHST